MNSSELALVLQEGFQTRRVWKTVQRVRIGHRSTLQDPAAGETLATLSLLRPVRPKARVQPLQSLAWKLNCFCASRCVCLVSHGTDTTLHRIGLQRGGGGVASQNFAWGRVELGGRRPDLLVPDASRQEAEANLE